MSIVYNSGAVGIHVRNYDRKTAAQEASADTFYDVTHMVKARQNSSGKRDGAVEDYVSRHPEDASHVYAQVSAGKAVRRKNGVEDISVEDMTMEEYKNYFNALLDSIPYDATRLNDDVFISISEEGWKQMKKDPDYEAWVLGYFVEDRAVRNPFFGWGNSGSVITEHFGASIEEHHGEGFSKSGPAESGKKADEETWWEKRHKRMKENLARQVKKAQIEAENKSREAKREYWMNQLQNQQRLHQFLAGEYQGDWQLFAQTGQYAPVAPLIYDNLIRTLIK